MSAYGLDDWGIGVQFPADAIYFTLLRSVQTGSGDHPPSYPMGTVGSFPGNKAAGAWSYISTPPHFFMVSSLSTATFSPVIYDLFNYAVSTLLLLCRHWSGVAIRPSAHQGNWHPQYPKTVNSLSWTYVTEWNSADWGNCWQFSETAVASLLGGPPPLQEKP
jgi:hypothetical protein